jgi:hypothetical protein
MSARPYRSPTRVDAANDRRLDSGATPFFGAVICALIGFLIGSMVTLNWPALMEWLREFA